MGGRKWNAVANPWGKAMRTTGLWISIAFLAGGAAAQGFPQKPVRLVVGFEAGGAADRQARIFSRGLSDEWKQPVVVENRLGAGTTLAAAYVAKAPPDGYTIYQAYSAHVISGALYRNLPYDTVRSFAPITLVNTNSYYLAVREGLGVGSLGEMIALAKARPKALTFASSGNGSAPHLAGEMLRMATGIDVVHVPYKGLAPAFAAVLAGTVDYLFSGNELFPAQQQGKLKVLAITGAKRSSLHPEVPTVAELGFPDYEVSFWSALLAPAGTPPETIARINASALRVLHSKDVLQYFRTAGYEPRGSTPEELQAVMVSDSRKYSKLIAELDLKAE